MSLWATRLLGHFNISSITSTISYRIISELWAQAVVSMPTSTLWAIKRSQLIVVCNFVKNQQIILQFPLLDFKMNDTCVGMNFIHLTYLMLLHHLVKQKHQKCT